MGAREIIGGPGEYKAKRQALAALAENSLPYPPISPQSRAWPWLASRKPPKVAIRLPPVMPGLVTWK